MAKDKITEAPLDESVQEDANVHELAGVADGTVLTTRDEEGNLVKEKIVYEYDEDGEYIGMHKEVVKK